MQVLNLLNQELALTMTLAGCARLDDITLDLLYCDPMFRATRVDGSGADVNKSRPVVDIQGRGHKPWCNTSFCSHIVDDHCRPPGSQP